MYWRGQGLEQTVKSRWVVCKNWPYKGPEGNHTFPRGAAPKEILLTQGTSSVWENFQTIPKAFPLLVKLWASTNKEDASCRVSLGLTLKKPQGCQKLRGCS